MQDKYDQYEETLKEWSMRSFPYLPEEDYKYLPSIAGKDWLETVHFAIKAGTMLCLCRDAIYFMLNNMV